MSAIEKRNALLNNAYEARQDAAEQLRLAADQLDAGGALDEANEMISTARVLLHEAETHMQAREAVGV